MNIENLSPLRVYECSKKIQKSIHALYDYIQSETKDSFLCNSILQDAVTMRLATIGEEIASILKTDKAFSVKFPNIEWHKMRAMRNVIVHDYFTLDKETLWDTVTQDLPPLEQVISQVINDNAEYYSDMEEEEDFPSP